MKALLLVLLSATPVLFAQGRVELRGTLGVTSFVDESAENHLTVAPSIRYYFTPRLAVEGEFQYLTQNYSGGSHYDIVALPSLVFDTRRSGRVIPYLSIGVGYIRSSYDLRTVRFSVSEVFGQGGVGVKFHLNDHWYVAPEFKVGAELHARISGTVGYVWR